MSEVDRMHRNTMAEINAGIHHLTHLYHAYQRTGDEIYAKRARKLLKRMRKQFKRLAQEMDLGKDEFSLMMRDWHHRD